jgi:hypothetical protein
MSTLVDGLQQALEWSGFRRLSAAEASAGPFAFDASTWPLARLDAAALNMAYVMRLESQEAIVRFLEIQQPDAWGYDLNLENHASHILTINELRFVITPEVDAITSELRWLGYGQQGHHWVASTSNCLVPALGSDFRGEIYPCLGWVLMAGASSEFGPAEQKAGFCTKMVPDGALFQPGNRNFQFVHEGYGQRAVTRRRIITFVDPEAQPIGFKAIVEAALVRTYGEI